jgi:hypothetical protein
MARLKMKSTPNEKKSGHASDDSTLHCSRLRLLNIKILDENNSRNFAR